MPVMDGYAATMALRQRPELRDMPVIAMTANAMVGDRERALAAGMNDHIAKPIKVEELFATLARWVRPGRTASGTGRVADEAHAAPSIPTLPGIDTRAGLDIMRGDVALYRKILCMFRDRERDFGARFRAALETGSNAAARHVHDLKGEAGAIGAYEIQLAAEALERACAQGLQTEEVTELAERVAGLLDPVIVGLQVLGPAPPT